MKDIKFEDIKNLAVNGVAYWYMIDDLDKVNANVIRCEYDDEVCIVYYRYRLYDRCHCYEWAYNEIRLAIG